MSSPYTTARNSSAGGAIDLTPDEWNVVTVQKVVESFWFRDPRGWWDGPDGAGPHPTLGVEVPYLHYHVIAGDPGKGRLPQRNAWCVMVPDITADPAEVVFFQQMGNLGMRSKTYKPYLNTSAAAKKSLTWPRERSIVVIRFVSHFTRDKKPGRPRDPARLNGSGGTP